MHLYVHISNQPPREKRLIFDAGESASLVAFFVSPKPNVQLHNGKGEQKDTVLLVLLT